MALSLNSVRRMISALGSRDAGNEVATAVNANTALRTQSSASIASVIVATAISTTTDFAALQVGDKVFHIPATAGNADAKVVATAGTLPEAAVVGDMYLVIRAAPAAVKSSVKL